MTAATWQGPRRGGMLLLVLLMHALLLVLLALALQRAPRFAAARVAMPALNLVWLRLPQVPPAQPAAAAHQAAPTKLPSHPIPMQPEAQRPAPPRVATEPQAISISPVPADADHGPPASPPPDATSPPPLDLRLPSHRASQPMPAAALTRDDPRVRERLSYSDRMARGIGTDNSLHEEALPDGSRRFSQGTGCVIARPSRISELDSFNNSSMPRPRGVGPC